MQVDPSDDQTFWATGMYKPSTSGWNTRIASFSISQFALPLTLLAFDGKQVNEKEIALTWKVENENNVDRYEIERLEDNGIYTKIASIDYKHHSVATNDYNYTDNSFNSLSTKEYRLKMIDQDGKYRYSNTVTISGEPTKTVTVYPNPITHDILYVRLSEALSLREVHVVLYNQASQKVSEIEKSASNHNQILTMDMNELASGMYYINVLDAQGNILSKEKVTKQ
jgi:hypothetical protein